MKVNIFYKIIMKKIMTHEKHKNMLMVIEDWKTVYVNRDEKYEYLLKEIREWYMI